MRKKRARVLSQAIAILGGLEATGEALGVTKQAVSQWDECPPKRVVRLSQATGIPRHKIRPDIFPPPEAEP